MNTICIWRRIIGFLPLRDLGNLTLVNHECVALVRASDCCDPVVISYRRYRNRKTFHVRTFRCILTHVRRDIDMSWLPTNAIVVGLRMHGSFNFDNGNHHQFPSTVTSLELGSLVAEIPPTIVFPPRLTTLICSRFREPIQKGLLPQTLQFLIFSDYETHNIGVGVLPPFLTSLVFGEVFNRPIGEGVLPNSLEKLVFGTYFDQPITANVFPQSLRSLTFGGRFDQRFEPDVLPNSLETLVLGTYFDQPITANVLPQSLRSLTFGYSFNRRIEPEVLPQSLRSLTFGYSFNQRIEPDVLPQSLRSLTFGYSFNQRIEPDVLPKSLTYLKFEMRFNNWNDLTHEQLLLHRAVTK